jgi:hypothetical protein
MSKNEKSILRLDYGKRVSGTFGGCDPYRNERRGVSSIAVWNEAVPYASKMYATSSLKEGAMWGICPLLDDVKTNVFSWIRAKFAKSHEKRLQDRINIEASRLLNVNNITRRLKRKKPFELVIR